MTSRAARRLRNARAYGPGAPSWNSSYDSWLAQEPVARAAPRTLVPKRGFGRKLAGFYGGNRPHANWLSRDDLMGALEHFGWRDIEVGFEQPHHPHGPSLSLTAVRG